MKKEIRMNKCSCGEQVRVVPACLFGYYVFCNRCKKSTKVYGSEKRAIQSWNFENKQKLPE
jgi:hypothetical protein